MTRRTLLAGLGWAIAPVSRRSEKTVYIGDTRVRLVVVEVRVKGQRGLIYFHPHENEHGSAVVTRHLIASVGGKLIEIRAQGERMVNFHLKGTPYSFDPNRMFTEIGLAHSLSHFGPTSEPALACATRLRDAVLAEFDDGKTPIISVHNNGENGMSALSFRRNGPLSEQASKIAVNPNENPHDFFLVLDKALFTQLHHAGFNTVLQSPAPPDDGSLSIFCQQRGWQYVNVEAAENDMLQQQRMLAALPAAFKTKSA